MKRNLPLTFAFLLIALLALPAAFCQDAPAKGNCPGSAAKENCPASSPQETYDGEPLCGCCGHGVTAPRATHTPDPKYDNKDRNKKVQGVVTLSVIVTKDGGAADIKVVKSLTPGLDEQAIKAVSRWRFDPAMEGGEPCSTKVNVVVQFRLY